MGTLSEQLMADEIMKTHGFDKEVPRTGYKIIGEVPLDLREEWMTLVPGAYELDRKCDQIRCAKGEEKERLIRDVKQYAEKGGGRAKGIFEAIEKRVPGFRTGQTRLFKGWVLANKVMSNVEFIYMLDRMDALLNPFDHYHPYHDRASCRVCCDG